MRVVVSGGAGFIGSHVVEALTTAGARVMVVDDMTHPCGFELPVHVKLITALCGSATAAREAKRFGPDVAIHLAAKGGVAVALRDPARHIRAVLAESVAFFQAAVDAGSAAVVMASSGGAVYGVAEATSEDVTPCPVSAYGAEKLCEEIYLRTLPVRTVALRLGNVYGPRQDGTGEAGVIALNATRLLRGDPALIYGDGLQTRDFVYVGDVAQAFARAAVVDVTGAINIGTGSETTINTVVGMLAHSCGGEVEHAAGLPGEARRSRLRGRASDALGWHPQTPLSAGLERTVQYFKRKVTCAS